MIKGIKILWSIYVWIIGGLIFLMSLLLMILWSYIFKRETWDPWFKALLKFMFHVVLVRVNVEGIKNFEKDKAYIFMPNHISLLDIPLMAGFIPVFIRGIEAHHHFTWPIYGKATKRYGNIPINRRMITKSMKSFEAAQKYIDANKSVIVFPESTRTKNGKLQKFKKMPFLLAQQTGAEIIPVGISGMFKLHPYGSSVFDLRSKLTIKFGKPINSEIIKKEELSTLAELCHDKVAELISD